MTTFAYMYAIEPKVILLCEEDRNFFMLFNMLVLRLQHRARNKRDRAGSENL